LPEIGINVFINTRSMMEMNYPTIKHYFRYINKNLKKGGIFFCNNRYYKDTVGYPVELHKYPFDDFWEILYSEKSWNQDHIHCLILKRVSKKLKDIQNEKKKLIKLMKAQIKKDERLIRRLMPNFLYFIYKNLKFYLTKLLNG
jgi:hypothetical protein